MKILIILKCSTYWVYHNTTIEVCTLKLHECLEIIINLVYTQGKYWPWTPVYLILGANIS